jgi:hypothetical protein
LSFLRMIRIFSSLVIGGLPLLVSKNVAVNAKVSGCLCRTAKKARHRDRAGMQGATKLHERYGIVSYFRPARKRFWRFRREVSRDILFDTVPALH